MKLLSLSLKGFRQHKDTSLEFKTGITGIIGSNGSGKSTLIEAIAFCLYGSKAIRGKLEQVKTMGSAQKQEVSISLIFEHDNITYRLERTLSEAALYIAGEGEAYIRGNVEVANKIASIFSMNYEEFSATFFTEQKGLEFLSGKKGAAERERFIVRLMGYDKLQELQELLRSDKKDKKNTILGWEASLGDRGKITETIIREEEELSLVSEKHDEARRVLENAEKEATKSKKAFELLNESFLKYAKIKQDISTRQIRYEEKGNRIKLIENKIKAYGDISEKLEMSYKKLLTNEIDIDSKALASAEIFGAALDKSINSFENKLDETKRNLEKLKAEQLEKELSIKADIRSAREQIASINEKNSGILSLDENSPCPTCGQELGKSLKSVKSHFTEELKLLNEKLQEKETEFKNSLKPVSEITELDSIVNSFSRKLSLLKESKSGLQELLYQGKEKQNLTKEISQIREELDKDQSEIQKIRKDLSQLNFSEENYNSAKTHYDACEALLSLSRVQRVKIEGEVEKYTDRIMRSKQILSEYDQKSAVLDKTKKELLLLEKSDQVLTDLRKHLNAQLRPRLSQLASEFLAELSDGRYNTVEIAQDFTPRVLEDGEIKMVISGGEEDLLNLCLRLALSNMLAERAGLSFSTLILDEVFGALDDNRRNNVLVLLEKLSKRFEQIFVITHLEDIREGVHNLISLNYNDSSNELEIVDKLNFEDRDFAVNL